jgi:hypothetical protein
MSGADFSTEGSWNDFADLELDQATEIVVSQCDRLSSPTFNNLLSKIWRTNYLEAVSKRIGDDMTMIPPNSNIVTRKFLNQ